jgi:predicted nucleic acid-binding protein
MSATDFLDSNVLLYLPTSETAKAEKVVALLADGGTVSIQVLNEFASVALRKLGRTMPEVRAALTNIRVLCTVVETNLAAHALGLDIAERYKFSIHDSMLLAAAQNAGCRTFYSEDLQHGQKIDNLTIRNPFRV